MKRYITHTLLCLLVLLVACNNSGLGLLPEDGDGNIVLNFSATDSQTRLGDHTSFESLVEHIDVFITDVQNAHTETIIHHERFTIGNNSNGTITLQGIRLGALKNKKIHIYAVANSTKDLSNLQEQSVEELKEKVEVQPLVYLTGTGLSGGGMTAPHSFLMWGEGKVGENTVITIANDFTGDLDVTLPLVRSVAKVEFHFLRETGLDSNGDSNGKTPNIHGFGYPKYSDGTDAVTPGGENNDIMLDGLELEYIAEGSYYFNNLPFKTYFAPNANSNIPQDGLRKTTPIYNNGHFHYESQDDVKIVAYVYSYWWNSEGDSEFESAPRMVVNLPAVVYNDGDREKGTYLEDNFYEIQLRMPSHAEGEEGHKKIYLRRNKYYIIKAKINAPGSKSSFEPIEIDQPIYFEERPWTDVSFNIGGNDGNHARATYLTLNTDLVEMRNVETDNKTLRFASSSPLSEIRLTKATYIDKWGVERDTTGFTYSVTYPENALQGSITINADLPENDALRSMTFSVKNSDATPLTETFTVKQYPAITISNIRAWFSYREDFNSWYTNDGERKGKAVWNDNNKTWSYPNNANSVWANNTVFISKVAKFESGTWKIYPYYWFQFIVWIKMDAQKLGDFGDYFASDLTNARIYHVTINATGAGAGAYTIGRPRMDSEGYTDAGPSNAQLISPSFMIASQLGESSNMASFTNYRQQAAKEHCKQYVEVYEDENGQEVHLKGWRLPTAAEIDILLDRQGIANAAVDEVLPGKQYISASGVVNGKAGGKEGIYIRCIRDHYVPTANAMNE